MPGATPVLSLQTASLYASNDASSFTGTGGPWGFSPWTSQFGGVVSSGGLAGEPFDDTVYEVASGDEVVFVIAVQNLAPGAAAYDVRVRSALPQGFVIPVDGTNLSVTDGAGTDLPIGGDLFSAAGLSIGAPLAAYDRDSGLNVALITYSLAAGPNLPGPYATVVSTASLARVAATPGGADVSGASAGSATTTIITAAPAPLVQPETDPAAVAQGQTIAFDVTIPVPSGTLRDLRLDTILPAGASSLSLVSVDVLRVGSQLRLGTPQVAGAGTAQFGTVQFGTVTSAGATDVADSASIVLRLVVRATGTSSGPATLETVISAADAASPGGRWTADVASSVGVVAPPASPQFTGIWTAQRATTTFSVRPFGALAIADGDPNQVGTLAITLSDGSLGRLSAVGGLGSVDASGSSFFATGTLSALQDAARRIAFTPSQAGVERFNVALVDAQGGVGQNGDAAVTIAASTDTSHLAQHFAASPTAVFLTATPDAQPTMAMGEIYAGPVAYLESQFIYDGAQTIAIVAQTPNVFVKNFYGDAAVAFLSGQNVVDAGKGSNFLVGGSGTDTFFLDGRSNAVTWDTIVGFHAGDVATLWGFRAGVATLSWDEQAGAPGYTGRTLRADLAGTGHPTASLTFAGADKSTTERYVMTTGQIGGTDYLAIVAQ